jgi:hypothetical protein
MIEMEVEDTVQDNMQYTTQDNTQAKEPIVVLQVAITEDDFNQFILNKPFNPSILAISMDKLNEAELLEFQNYLSGALSVILNTRLRELADKMNGIQDADYEESEE